MQNQNVTIFFLQINTSKVIRMKSYFSLFNTEETHILIIFPIFYIHVIRHNSVGKVRILECRLGSKLLTKPNITKPNLLCIYHFFFLLNQLDNL